MTPHTPEPVALRDLPAAPVSTDPAPLTAKDLAPHLRGLARALRNQNAGRAAPGRTPSP